MEVQKLDKLEIIPKNVKKIFLGLHGYGSDAEDLLNLGLQFRSVLKDTAIITVNGPFDCENRMMGYQWFSLRTMNLFKILNLKVQRF